MYFTISKKKVTLASIRLNQLDKNTLLILWGCV